MSIMLFRPIASRNQTSLVPCTEQIDAEEIYDTPMTKPSCTVHRSDQIIGSQEVDSPDVDWFVSRYVGFNPVPRPTCFQMISFPV